MLAYKKNIHNYIVRSTHRGKGIRSKAKSGESFRRDSFLFGEFGENVDKRIDIDKREREREKGREEEGARRRKCQDRDESRFGYDGNIASVRSHLVQRAHPPFTSFCYLPRISRPPLLPDPLL